jgi:PAS domain S-box-containing protein
MADLETERFIAASDAALRLFGYSRDEFMGLRPKDIVVAEEHSGLEARRARSRARWGEGHTWTCIRRDGSRFTMKVRFHVTEVNGRQAYLVMATDVRDIGVIAS